MVVAVWRGPSSVEAAETLVNVMLALSAAHPAGFRYLSVVEATSTPPSAQARNIQAWLSGTLGHRAIAVGCAIESSRLMTLVAPVFNACLFLGGVPVDARLFPEVRQAVMWVSQHGTTGTAEITAAIAALRRALDDAVPG